MEQLALHASPPSYVLRDVRASVVRLLRRRRVEHHAADDLAQEALLACMRPEVRPRNFRVLAKHVAQNLAKNLRRRDRSVIELTQDLSSDGAERPSHRAMQNEQSQSIEGAMSVLTSETQRIVRLRHEERLDFADIAAKVHLTEAAVRKRYTRALGQIRAAMTRSDTALRA